MAESARIEWIRKRAAELLEREGRGPENEQACWDKAVDEYEKASSEAQRGPVHPDPEVGSSGNT